MRYNIALSLEAEDDILNAYKWYEQQRAGLGAEFIAAPENSFSSIQSGPDIYGFRKKNIRGCLLKRFPYLVLFFIDDSSIRIISVFHTHRKPTI